MEYIFAFFVRAMLETGMQQVQGLYTETQHFTVFGVVFAIAFFFVGMTTGSQVMDLVLKKNQE